MMFMEELYSYSSGSDIDRLETTLDFAGKYKNFQLSSTNHGRTTLDNESKPTPI